MIRPLKAGDKIGIVAPGRKVKRYDVDAAEEIFSSWGLRVVFSDNLFSNSHSYLAGSDTERLEDFQLMLSDKSIQAIVCARGGYGCTRILDKLDFTTLQLNPKWIVGFSDITALHLQIHKLGMTSVHGPMPIMFSKPDSGESIESLRKILFGEDFIIRALPGILNRHGKCTAPVIGGNLSLIVDALGTRSEPDTRGKILVLEEIDEYLYKIDRMIVQLKRAGKLNALAGLVLGHFTDIKDTELSFGESAEEIIRYHTSTYSYPIGFNFPIGHENPNLAWKHGDTMELLINEEEAFLRSIA